MSVTINGIKYGKNIYLVSVQDWSYDEYDSVVVYASSEEEVKELTKWLFRES